MTRRAARPCPRCQTPLVTSMVGVPFCRRCHAHERDEILAMIADLRPSESGRISDLFQRGKKRAARA